MGYQSNAAGACNCNGSACQDDRACARYAVPALTGAGHIGWFRSEFGANSWPSFESISANLPPEQWGMNSAAAVKRNWNVSNMLFVYFGQHAAARDMKRSGETAFKRVLYMSMISQLLFMKTEVESWRSSNVFGTLTWQLNDVWPTAGWGSLEYGGPTPGQVVGGRWRPLHYQMKSSIYANQLASCNSAGACFVTNDSPFAFNGTVSVRLVNAMTGKSAGLSSYTVVLPPGAGVTSWFCAEAGGTDSDTKDGDTSPPRTQLIVPAPPPPPQLNCSGFTSMVGWETVGCDATGSSCVLDVTVINTTRNYVSRNVNPFVAPSLMNLPGATIAFEFGAVSGNTVPITLRTNATVLFVVLTTTSEGRFSDNAFLLEPPSITIDFVSWKDTVDSTQLAELRKTLRVEHLSQYIK